MSSGIIEKITEKYERYVAPVAFLVGFAFDNITLWRIDFWLDNVLIVFYLLVSGICIALLTLEEAGRLRGRLETLGRLALFILQFSLGGLFSVFFIFYWRSSAFVISWPFLVTLAFLLIGNEFFRKRYQRLTFRMSIYFVALYSYSIFAVPILYGKIGVNIFLLSGLISLVLAASAALIFSMAIPRELRKSRRSLLLSISGIYIAFHVLYFLNVIPPIPLSLKDGGIYHSVERSIGGQYHVQFEKNPWYAALLGSVKYHWVPGSAVYVYSAVFAPTKLNTTILHRWSYYDIAKSAWVEKDRLGFTIVGGRDGGYRGYSMKQNIIPGGWRVDVINERGQVLGRMSFTVIATETEPALESALR